MLLRHPRATTDLLIEICTVWKTELASQKRAQMLYEAGPAAPSHADWSQHLTSFKPPVVLEGPDDSHELHASAKLGRSDPKQFFPDFVDQPSHFRRFLESVADKRWNQRIENVTPRQGSYLHRLPIALDPDTDLKIGEDAQQQAVWNTLLELYLSGTVLDGGEKGHSSDRDQALALLEQIDRLPLDPVHALMLCSAFKFESGLMCLWERLGMYEEIVRFWGQSMGSENHQEQGSQAVTSAARMLEYLNIYGPTQLQLYPLVLRYITSSANTLAQHTTDVCNILDTIQQERIMPPLAIIQLLSRNNATNIGVIKDWLKRQVRDTRLDIDSVSVICMR